MEPKLSTVQRALSGETSWCTLCITLLLLGNVFNLLRGADWYVTVAYAAMSSLTALLAGVWVILWLLLRD